MRINKSLLCLSFLFGLGLTSCGNANNQASSKEPEGPKKAQVIVMSGQSNMEGSTLWGEGEITSSDATDVNPAHGADDNWLEKAFNDLELEDDVNDYIEGNVPEIQIVPSGFNLSRHKETHCLLKSLSFSKPCDLSQSPLFTETIFPPLHEIPSPDKKYGGSANIKSTDSSGICFKFLKQSPCINK